VSVRGLIVASLVPCVASAGCGEVAAAPADAAACVAPSSTAVQVISVPGADGGAPRDAAADVVRAADATTQADAVTDAALPTDAQLSVPALAACVGGSYVFAVDASQWFPTVSGPQSVTGATGSWSASILSGSFLEVVVDGATTWSLQATSNSVVGQWIGLGTYSIDGSNLPRLGISIADSSCVQGSPSGTFTIVEYAASPGDQATVSRLLLWFDLSCPGQGELTGCVSYGR
jgi:hypothetical protein